MSPLNKKMLLVYKNSIKRIIFNFNDFKIIYLMSYKVRDKNI